MGALAGALIQAGIGAAANIGGALVASKSAERINKQEMANAEENRRWQTAEREAQNAWSLEQWNREIEYNSIGAQIQRARDAGLSPLSIMNGANAGEAAHLESAAPASAPSMPRLLNPGEAWQRGLAGAAEAGQSAFIQYQQLALASKETEARVKNLEGDTAHKWSLAKTENELRDGRLQFLGVQIRLGESQTDVNKENLKAIAQSIEESKKRIEQLNQWISESGTRVSLMEYQKYCASRKIDKEVALLGQQILLTNQQAIDLKLTRGDRRYLMKSQSWLNNAQTTGHDYANMISRDYVESGQYRTDRINRGKMLANDTDSSYWRKKQAEGGTYSDFGYAVVRGLGQLNMLTSSVKDVLQGFFFLQQGKQISSQLRISPVSSPNPSQAAPYSEIYY